MGEVTRKVWKCDRCGHEWLSRDGENPLRCAKCKSPYWNRPKIEGQKIKSPSIRKPQIKKKVISNV